MLLGFSVAIFTAATNITYLLQQNVVLIINWGFLLHTIRIYPTYLPTCPKFLKIMRLEFSKNTFVVVVDLLGIFHDTKMNKQYDER